MAQAKKALSNGRGRKGATRTATKTYHNYIGGEWVPSRSGETFENINPADTRDVGKVLKETGGDVQEAIDGAFYRAGGGGRLHGFPTPAEMPDKFAMCVR